MKKSSLLTLPALMLLAGCQLDSLNNDRGEGLAPVDPKKAEWEALPTGKSFLQDGVDSNGVPIYVPVKFQDSSALIHGDIAIATGEAQLADLRAKLVDPEEHQPAALGKSSGVVKTSTITGGVNAWPGGFVPYFIGGGVNANLVQEAVYEFNQAGGISYIPWQSKHTSYVVFLPTSGPTSYSGVGMVNASGPQGIYIKLGHGRSVMLHEMAHAAGMYHEQMRSDRDNFVTVTTSGVDDGGWYAANWAKVLDGTNIGAYDPLSIMHYGAGTNTYTRTNGLLYKVTMTSKTGAVLGGSTPTATDKLSFWNIAANGFPFHVQTVRALPGKVTKLYTTYANGVTKRFIVIYDPATGNANVNAVNDDNTYGSSVQNYNVGAGFNLISPYQSATGQHMLFYSSTTGAVKLFNLIPAGGAISPGAIATSTWLSGWNSIDHYESGVKHYWYFQNRSTGANHIWAVANNGTLGANTMSTSWPGWNYAKPFYSETSPYVHSAFIVFRTTAGLTRIRRLNSDGTMGTVVQDVQLPSAPAVGVYQSVTKAYLALAGVNALYLVDMDHTGFSARGTPFFRVAGLPSTVTRMDAAADRFSMNASSSTINSRVFDMKHVISFEYQSNPGAVFTAWGAPFH